MPTKFDKHRMCLTKRRLSFINTECVWQNTNVFDRTPNLFDRTPNVFDRTPNVFDRTPNVFDRTPNVFDRTPNVFDRTPNVFDRTPNVFNRTPSVFDRTPTTFCKQRANLWISRMKWACAITTFAIPSSRSKIRIYPFIWLTTYHGCVFCIKPKPLVWTSFNIDTQALLNDSNWRDITVHINPPNWNQVFSPLPG
jgi:hypothetical protein